MAYRVVPVIEVREVLRGWLAGAGLPTVAAQAGVDRKTARRYVQAAEAAGVAREGGVCQLSEEVIGLVVAAVRPARPAGHGSAWALLVAEREQITVCAGGTWRRSWSSCPSWAPWAPWSTSSRGDRGPTGSRSSVTGSASRCLVPGGHPRRVSHGNRVLAGRAGPASRVDEAAHRGAPRPGRLRPAVPRCRRPVGHRVGRLTRRGDPARRLPMVHPERSLPGDLPGAARPPTSTSPGPEATRSAGRSRTSSGSPSWRSSRLGSRRPAAPPRCASASPASRTRRCSRSSTRRAMSGPTAGTSSAG